MTLRTPDSAPADFDNDQAPPPAPSTTAEDMVFHELCPTADVEEGVGKPFSIDGNHLAVYRYEDGFYACDNRCPHMGYPLSEGSVRDGVLICHWHHWEFDLKTGGCFLTNGDDVASFPIDVRDDVLFVGIPKG
ncbi:MAG: Rieske (2Fe-2S) protein, partial [Gemmatimonadetes bacterium]|nr:Rieske (2Fe-2S) protein [Gemmatimonadota bacterium]